MVNVGGVVEKCGKESNAYSKRMKEEGIGMNNNNSID
jgi:hypothetical protein